MYPSWSICGPNDTLYGNVKTGLVTKILRSFISLIHIQITNINKTCQLHQSNPHLD